MNSRTKKRLIIVTGVIILILALLLAVIGGGTSAKTISLKEATSGSFVDQRVQVTGTVVKDSYSTSGNVLSFQIYDPEDLGAGQLRISYDGAASSTFGNDVVAICTGKIDRTGMLVASEMITKCPSKYESGTDALEVERLLGYGDDVVGTTVRVQGSIVPNSQNPAGEGPRFIIADTADTTKILAVQFNGAVSEEALADNASIVVTGNMLESGDFSATDVALRDQSGH